MAGKAVLEAGAQGSGVRPGEEVTEKSAGPPLGILPCSICWRIRMLQSVQKGTVSLRIGCLF